jgi:hypothetical protein
MTPGRQVLVDEVAQQGIPEVESTDVDEPLHAPWPFWNGRTARSRTKCDIHSHAIQDGIGCSPARPDPFFNWLRAFSVIRRSVWAASPSRPSEMIVT